MYIYIYQNIYNTYISKEVTKDIYLINRDRQLQYLKVAVNPLMIHLTKTYGFFYCYFDFIYIYIYIYVCVYIYIYIYT